MFKFRKVFALGIFLLLLFSTSLASAAALPDTTDHWAEEEIRQLVGLGAITGYPDGTYRPENTISRAEFASVLRGALGLEEAATLIFPDKAGHWGQGRIGALIQAGVIDTELYGEVYGPDESIAREEIAMMTARMLGAAAATEVPFADAGQIGHGFRQYVAEAYSLGIITGYPDNTFRPAGTATRAEAAVMVIRALALIQDDQDVVDEDEDVIYDDDLLPGQVGDEPHVFKRVEYYELGENAAEVEDVEVIWDDKVRFISDELADRILQAEKEAEDKELLIKLTRAEAIYEPEEYLVHVEKHVAYMVVRKIIGDEDEDDDPLDITYVLLRANLEDIFEDLSIPEQTVELKLDNIAYVGEGIEVLPTGNPNHTFRFTNQQYMDGAITVNGEIRLFYPSIDIHYKLGKSGDKSNFHVEFHAGEEIDLEILGQLDFDRRQEILVGVYGLDIGRVGQASLNVYLIIDVEGNISFEYRVDQGYHIRTGVRGDKGRIFPKIRTVDFYYEPESWLEVEGYIDGELQLIAGVKGGVYLNLFSYDIFYLEAECGVVARAEFEAQLTAPYQQCFTLELYAYLDANGEVMYIVPKRGLPPWESRVRAFNIYSNVWLIYKYQSCDQEIDGSFGTGEQALVEGANTLSVKSSGAENVYIQSNFPAFRTNYFLTGIAPGTTVRLIAPEYIGYGWERKEFERWSGAHTSTDRSINFIIDTEGADLSITAHYVEDPGIYTLQVKAPEGVEIESGTGHGGVGDYEITEIVHGTTVDLQAPVIREEREREGIKDDFSGLQIKEIWHRPFLGWYNVGGPSFSESRMTTFLMRGDRYVEARYGSWSLFSGPGTETPFPQLPENVLDRLRDVLDGIVDAMGIPDPELPPEEWPLHPDFWDFWNGDLVLEPDFFWEELWKDPDLFNEFWTMPGLHDQLQENPGLREEVSQSPEAWDELLANPKLWDDLVQTPQLHDREMLMPFLQDEMLLPELRDGDLFQSPELELLP